MKLQLQSTLTALGIAFATAAPATAQFSAQFCSSGTTSIQSLSGSNSAMYVIDEPGSYTLRGNLYGVSGKNGIEVNASNVTIDLNGFLLRGIPGSHAGISIGNNTSGLVVRNGTIRGWDGGGVQSHGNGLSARYDRVRAFENYGPGLSADSGSRVELCVAAKNGAGIVVAGGSVDSCIAPDNSSRGVHLTGIGIVRRVVVHETGLGAGAGIRLEEGGGHATECVVVRGSVVIQAGNGQKIATVQRSLVADSTSSLGGIYANSTAVLRDNLITGHTGYAIQLLTGAHHVEGNLATYSGANAFTVGGAGVAMRNASTRNAQGDNWNFVSAAAAGSFLPPGVITTSNPFGHPLF